MPIKKILLLLKGFGVGFLVLIVVYAVSLLSREQPVPTSQAVNSITAGIETEGVLQAAVIEQFDTGVSRTEYEIISDLDGTPNSTKLNISETSDLVPGSVVRVKGGSDGAALNISSQDITTINSGESVNEAVPSGSRKVAIVLMNWTNQTTTIPSSYDVRLLFNTVEEFYLNQSNNNLVLTNTASDIFGWTQSNLAYDCNVFMNWGFSNPLDNAVTSYLNSLGIPPGTYAHTIIVMPMRSGCDSGAVASLGGDRSRYSTRSFRPSVIAHELGHNFRAKHAGMLTNCPTATNQVSTACSYYEYGYWDTMGTTKPDNSPPWSFSPYYKEFFGWNTTANVLQVRNSGSFDVHPLETATSNVKNLQVCRDAHSYYSIENRINTGYDSNIEPAATQGAIIRLVGASSSGFPSLSYPNSTTYLMGGGGKAVGSTMLDATAGLSIRVNSKTNNIVNVTVNYTGSLPASCPSVIAPPPPPLYPSLISPQDKITTHNPRPTLTWSAFTGAVSYELQMATDPAFTNLVFPTQNRTTTSYLLTQDLVVSKTYYWRVRAKKSNGQYSSWSPVRSLRYNWYTIMNGGNDYNCATNAASPEVYFGAFGGCTQGVAYFNFTNLRVDSPSQVLDAYARFTTDGPYSAANPLSAEIRVGFGSTYSSWIPWNISTNWQSGGTVSSPSLKSAIQQIINNPSWAKGQTLNVNVRYKGGQVRRVFAFERDPLKSASLVIDIN